MDIPTRYRSAEQRNARIARPVKWAGRVKSVDEDLMNRLARGFMETDDLGAELAVAMRLPMDDPNRVAMADFRRALAGGVASVDDAPPALAKFFATVESVPEWVDWDLLEQGGRTLRRLGQNAADVLLQLSLIGGYRFGGPTDLLVATGGLTGDATIRRLGETQKWTISVTQPGAMRPGAEGWRLTVHVRLMHALVNDRFAERWDVQTWGMPINQSDQAATLGLFSGVPLMGSRLFGARFSDEDSRAAMHLWRYVGWLMGVDEQWLLDTEREQHRLNYHVLLVQADVTEAGAQLANAIVDGQSRLHFDRFARLRRWYARERLLSMLTPQLGVRSMRDLKLPIRPPWAPALVVLRNIVRYWILGRSERGQDALLRWGDRVQQQLLLRHFGPDVPVVGELHV